MVFLAQLWPCSRCRARRDSNSRFSLLVANAISMEEPVPRQPTVLIGVRFIVPIWCMFSAQARAIQ